MKEKEVHSIIINATDFIFKDAKIESCLTNMDLLAHNLYVEINKHETNLLKEFVEQYKQVLTKDYNDKVYMLNKAKEFEELKLTQYYQGQCNAIQRLITLLDSDLKKFLEAKRCK